MYGSLLASTGRRDLSGSGRIVVMDFLGAIGWQQRYTRPLQTLQ